LLSNLFIPVYILDMPVTWQSGLPGKNIQHFGALWHFYDLETLENTAIPCSVKAKGTAPAGGLFEDIFALQPALCKFTQKN
jgi:hypothetical protein